jgi:hypothetical protein
VLLPLTMLFTSPVRPSFRVTSDGEMAKLSTTTTAGRGSISLVSTWLSVEVQALAKVRPKSAIAPSADLAKPEVEPGPALAWELPATASRMFIGASFVFGRWCCLR